MTGSVPPIVLPRGFRRLPLGERRAKSAQLENQQRRLRALLREDALSAEQELADV